MATELGGKVAQGPADNDNEAAAPLPLRLEGNQREDTYSLLNLMVLCGMKGATKTTNLVRLGLKAQIQWNRPVFSDFPYKAEICGRTYVPEPMPDEVFVTYGKGIPRNAVLLCDELQEFFDRQSWMSVESKLGVSVFQQIRKLGFLVIGATQFFAYLNTRINEQVDILVRCRDLRLTPWGINEGIKRGREAILEYYDLCGAFDVRGTARSPRNVHFVTGEPFAEELVFTEAFWKFFASDRLTAIEHRFRKYELRKERRVVSASFGGPECSPREAEAKDAISSLVGELKGTTSELIRCGGFNDILRGRGHNISMALQAKIMKEIGYESFKQGGNNRYWYDLSGD